MTYPRHYNTERGDRGVLLADVLIALSLATLFIVTYTDIMNRSRIVYERARNREDLLDVFVAHRDEYADLMPYGSRTGTVISPGNATTSIVARAHWYGNDRIETRIRLANAMIDTDFVSIRSYPFADMQDAAGTPLCTPDFSAPYKVGSYQFFHPATSSPMGLRDRIHITPIPLPVPGTIVLTDLEIRDGVAFISTDSARASDPDIFIIDISDPGRAEVVSGINTGPGIAGIAIAGDYVYAVATSRVGQLQIIHIPELRRLSIVANYRLPPPEASSTLPIGSSIFYQNGRIYLGTEKWDGDEFSIIDVGDPARLIYLGGINTDSKINDIVVRDTSAYIAASDQFQLRRVDISDERSPRTIDAFDPSGWERQEGKSLAYFEDNLMLGRTTGGFNIRKDHELFRWFQATSTLSNLPGSIDHPGGIYGIVPDRPYVFLATRQSGGEFQILDHSLSTTTALVIPLPVPAQSMTCDGDSIYVLGMGSSIIYKISFK